MRQDVLLRHLFAALGVRLRARLVFSSSRGAPLALNALALVTLSSLPAAAQPNGPEPLRLEWIRLEGAESCPSRRSFEHALVHKLGGNPFTSEAPRTLTIELSNEAGPFRAVLSLHDASAAQAQRDALANAPDAPRAAPPPPASPHPVSPGPPGVLTSRQELFSYSTRCDELFAAAVLTVSLLLQPVVPSELDDATEFGAPDELSDDELEPAPDAPPHAAVSAEPYRPPQDATSAGNLPRAPVPWSRTAPQAELTLIFAIEQLPESGFGFGLRTDFPIGARWLFHLEGDWLPAQGKRVGNGDAAAHVSVSATTAWLGVTWIAHRSGPIEMLVDASVGASFLHALIFPAESSDSGYFPLATTRLGAGAAAHLNDQVVLRASAVAILPLDRVEVGPTSQANRPLWALPRLGGQAQLGLAIAFH